MDTNLVAKSLSFHGQPLQKIWEGERGNHDLYRLGITNPDYSVYAIRQKNLTFQDRAKRLKLHQFIARKASVLFDSGLVDDSGSISYKEKNVTGASVTMPPFESFLSKSIDKNRHIHKILEIIQPGDIVYGTVLQRSSNGLLVKVLCTGEPVFRYLADLTIKAYVLSANLVPAHDKRGNQKPYVANDYVCCEVLDISADADRLSLGMKGSLTIDAKAPLGPISAEQMPEYYKRTIENPDLSFTDLLEKSDNFQNPNLVDNLFQEVGLNFGVVYSNMSSLKYHFPQQEYALELRQIQASKWAFRSVADGIELFKVGRHAEAFQCLNKALSIDPRNVEGLVARGALYANSGSFKKAVDDFETALKLNPYHANARKYMGETLVALGRSYEEENRFEEARKAYKDCLNIIPHHEEAKSSLEFLNGKASQIKQLIDTNELLPGFKNTTESTSKDIISTSSKKDDMKKEKSLKRKKKNKSHHKRANVSSSSGSENSSETSTSSSSESSDSSDGSSTSESNSSPTKKSKRSNKQRSLSPLSKRMAIMDEQNPTSTTRYQFNQPFHLANAAAVNASISNASGDDYDTKVRNFLEMTRDEDDYESRVRSLVEEVSKYRKERKTSGKQKKKDKKKQKKLKKESKKSKKKKEKEKGRLQIEGIDNMELKEALKIVKSLPMLDLESKVTADLQKYEKNIDLHRPSTSKASEYFRDDSDSPRNDIHEHKRSTPPPTKRPKSPPRAPSFPKTSSALETSRSVVPPPKPPVVLDKFGSFRLAAPEEKIEKSRRSTTPSPRRQRSRSRSHSSRSNYRRETSPRRSRSMRRSRSPRRHSRSRSRRRSRSLYRESRSSLRRSPRWSPRRRSPRRRSRSMRRSRSQGRSFSRRRSMSRSKRMTRSRSRSTHRRGSRSPIGRRSRSNEFSGGGGGGRYRRSLSRSPSFNRSRSRSPWRRGRGRGGFRGRGFFQFRGRGRGRGGFRGRRSPFFRGRNFSPERSPINRRDDESSVRTSKQNKGKKDGIEGKWTHDKYEKNGSKDIDKSEESGQEENWDDDNNGEPSVEEIDKIINKAQKERKEEILQRDKDLLKKPTPTNVPF